MSRSNPPEIHAPATRGAIHLVMQGKGGVGKTLVSTWLAEYLLTRRKEVRCIDGDPVNRSLAQYAALNADKLDLVNSTESWIALATMSCSRDSRAKRQHSC
jgi:CO dehydrogenase nickel-insertion accessory protein CooC1